MSQTFTQSGLTGAKVWKTWVTHPVRAILILWELLCFLCRARPHEWWKRTPFLPLPPREYLDWRLETAYGNTHPSKKQVLYDLYHFGYWLHEFRPYIRTGKLKANQDDGSHYLGDRVSSLDGDIKIP